MYKNTYLYGHINVTPTNEKLFECHTISRSFAVNTIVKFIASDNISKSARVTSKVPPDAAPGKN